MNPFRPFSLLAMVMLVGAVNGRAQPAPESLAIQHLRSAASASPSRAEKEFWDSLQGPGTPLIEPVPGDAAHSLVTFVWRGGPDVRNVAVITPRSLGDFPGSALELVPGTQTWFRTYLLPNDARFNYRFAENDSGVPFDQERNFMKRMQTWRVDPLNPRRFEVAPGVETSVLELSGAPSTQWSRVRTDVPHGEVRAVTLPLGGAPRKAWLYSPPGGAPAKNRPLILFLDGQSYTSLIPGPTILDNLIAARSIRPTAALFLAASDDDRDTEYNCNPAFADRLINEVLPYATRELKAGASPQQTIVAGSSLGGLQAACTAVAHPERFGAVLAQSGSFYRAPPGEEPEALTRRLAAGPARPLRWYLEVGLLEVGAIPNRDPSMLTASRHLRDVLTAKGATQRFREYYGGHEHLAWRESLPIGLQFLLAPRGR